MILAFLISAGAPVAAASTPDLTRDWVSEAVNKCKSGSPGDILVCGMPSDRFRIDPSVLRAERALNAQPPKPPVTADEKPPEHGCVGAATCQHGGFVPLIAMALVAAKAAELAATGGDWRDAIRIHQDDYQLYKEAEERKAEERKVRVLGMTVGNSQ